MPSKALKKVGNKRKQNGKKVIRSQAIKTKQKYETESSPKEQISELEKEIFSIKINEFESKLNRKKRLCSYMEEEISIYKTLYNEKQLLKSESMKLLNNAFEDFSTEIFLLDQELNAMQHSYNEILKEQKFCCSYREKVEKLSLLEAKLGRKLNEAEKCSEQIPTLFEKFEYLQKEAMMRKENFITEDQNIITEFKICLHRIEEELNCTVNKIIDDDDLKLDLLPIPYKSLFLSGLLSNSWLESALNCLVFLQTHNTDLERKCYEFVLSVKKLSKILKALFSQEDVLDRKVLKTHKEKEKTHFVPVKTLKDVKIVIYERQDFSLLLQIEKMRLHQHNKVESIKSEVKQLEKAIKSVETSGETCFDRSYLIQVICTAGSILKGQL